MGNSDFAEKSIVHALFTETQGYPILENTVCEDNMATMKILKNRRKSCGKQSRHIEIRHYFVKDFMDKNKIILKHYPAALILADFFTKPLQGALFRLFRDVILGLRPMTDVKFKNPTNEPCELLSSSALKERVEINNKNTVTFEASVPKTLTNNNNSAELNLVGKTVQTIM